VDEVDTGVGTHGGLHWWGQVGNFQSPEPIEVREGGFDSKLADATYVTQLVGQSVDSFVSDLDASMGVVADEGLAG
jgi:hypothetical protein